MPSIDMPLEQLRQYKPALYREDDFEQYWDSTVSEAINQPLNAELIPYDLPLGKLQVYAVRFDGFQGGRIAGWYIRPQSDGRFPGVCCYHGYGGRGVRPADLVWIAAQGICVLSMDTRGQNNQSQDGSITAEGNYMGWMTRGIRDPKSYYYRFVYADAVRAMELLARREEVDPDRLAVTGVSQGGGISLAVAALSERPILAMADVPFLCDFRRAIQVAITPPYTEIPAFLKSFPHLYDTTMGTLSYCDNLNLAPWIKCQTVISNNLWDDICPPSTIFGVYHHITAEKQMDIYPFHNHDVCYEQKERQLRLLNEVLQP